MLWGLGVLSVIGVFLLSWWIPAGVAISNLFMVPVLIGLWIPDKKYIHLSAATGSVLVVAGYFFSDHAG